MALPQPNPARLSAPAPFFQDNSLVRGDQARNNNAAIWTDMEYIDGRCDTLDSKIDTEVGEVATELQEYIDNKASEAEAEAGSDNEKWMTPLRTLQSIQANAIPASTQLIAQAIGRTGANRIGPYGVQFTSISYGNGVFVAVARTGANRVWYSLYTGIESFNGVSAAEANTWESVAYGNGVFVAVSSDGTNRVMRSTDNGLTWSAIAAAEANEWSSISYGNGVFVAVARTGTNRVMRSTDYGVSWVAVSAAEANTWTSVTYGNGIFVAVASSGTNRVMRSTDNGLTWSAIAAAAANSWVSIAYGNNVFMAVSSDGTNRVMRSTDNGLTWSAIQRDTDELASIACGLGSFIIMTNNGSPARTTDNGTTWVNITSGVSLPNWKSIAYGEGIFVAVSVNESGYTMRIA